MAQFGVYLPNVGWDELPTPVQMADYAVAAEDFGLHSLWVEDRLLHPRIDMLDPLTVLSFAASRTHTIKLGTSVLLPNLRTPLPLAKTLSTLDYLSDGRLIIGASLGGRPDEYRAAGASERTRVSRFVKTLQTMRNFWGQGEAFPPPVSRAMTPHPKQPRIPIWIGGRADPVYKRVVTLGDGWLASSTTDAQEFARGWARIREEASAVARPMQELAPAKFCYIHIDDNTQAAQAVLNTRMPRYYDFPYDVNRSTLYGPPARCAERAQSYLDAGVETLIFAMVTKGRGQLQRLCEEVIPLLR